MIDFDKLFLVRDSEYGTHVTYICDYPNHLFLDFFTDSESLEAIFCDIQFHIDLQTQNNKKED